MRGVPREVVRRTDLARGERVLAATPSGDTWLLGTRLALYVVRPHDVHRIAWDAIEQAGWDQDDAALTVAETGEWGEERPVHRFAIEEPGRLLELLRERVSASVLLQRRVPVAGALGVTVVARRSPADGEVQWRVEYDEGLDPGDPSVRSVVDRALGAAEAEIRV